MGLTVLRVEVGSPDRPDIADIRVTRSLSHGWRGGCAGAEGDEKRGNISL